MSAEGYAGRVGLIQRVLPSYRVPFFEALAGACGGGLGLFAGQPRPDESIDTSVSPRRANLAAARNLHPFPTSSPLFVCYQDGLLDWLSEWDPQALIVEANFRYLSSPAGIHWMKERRRPVIGWGLGAPVERGLFSGLRQSFLRKFDALIAYSQAGAEQYAAAGLPSDRIFVAPNAVAPAPTRPLPTRPATVPRLTVLFIGRLQTRKRIPALLKACAALEAARQPRLVIVGDGPEAASLRELAREIYPSAEFTGARHGLELEPYLLAADLFVLPGTGGLAVQEAMSFGLPVIAGRGDGTQTDLVRPTNGWQIPPDDDAALAATLREALADVPRLRSLGAESYRIVKEEINLEKMVSVFVTALNAV